MKLFKGKIRRDDDGIGIVSLHVRWAIEMIGMARANCRRVYDSTRRTKSRSHKRSEKKTRKKRKITKGRGDEKETHSATCEWDYCLTLIEVYFTFTSCQSACWIQLLCELVIVAHRPVVDNKSIVK